MYLNYGLSLAIDSGFVGTGGQNNQQNVKLKPCNFLFLMFVSYDNIVHYKRNKIILLKPAPHIRA